MRDDRRKRDPDTTVPEDDFWASILNETMAEAEARMEPPKPAADEWDELLDDALREAQSRMGEDKTLPGDGEAGPEDGGTAPEESGTLPEEGEAGPEDAAAPLTIRKGSLLLDTYRVESDVIGKGGMGAVWKVHHIGWDTELAMKRPKAEAFQTEKQKESFTRECDCWINLGLHPNIVSCYYVRELGGVPTIFSEWMENGDLENRITDGTLYEGSDREVQTRLLDIAIQFARGLRYAHENNLVHQDVKPDNLLLTKDWEAKVSDFGIARARSLLTVLEGEWTQREYDPNATQMTPSGGMTFSYCSPEQAARQLLTKRTDIYSWAVSVLEMYLGCKPWARRGVPTGPLVGLACRDYFAMCTERPVPAALRELLAKCLEQNPDDRPRDFGAVEAALLDIYKTETGADYPRPAPKAAADTADSLNNRALSFLDLGREEEAERLLRQATDIDKSVFLYHYNYALLRWSRMEISDAAFLAYLKQYGDSSALCQSVMDKLSRIRGEEEYSYSDRENGRPDTLEALLPPSKTSADKRFRVEGYMEKRPYELERYGYRLEDLQTGEIRDFPNNYEDYGVSTSRYGGTYMHPHYYKSDHVFFVGPHSEIIVMAADVLWFFEAKSGRLLLSLPPVKDDDGDTWAYKVLGYTESGVIEFMNTEQLHTVHSIRLDTEESLPYELAGIATVNARLEAEGRTEENYRQALACWERRDVYGTWQALSKSLADQMLTSHEPSLRLWSRMSAYYPRGRLIAVLPTEDEPTPVPERFACREDQHFSMSSDYRNRCENGQTELLLERREEESYDTCMDMYDYTFYFSLHARDIRSGETYFEVRNLEIANEADWKRFSKDRYLGLEGDRMLWYADEYEGEKTIDLLKEPNLRLALPGGCWLQNTEKGVDIGGFVFDDKLTDFRPLWNADVIACRDHNYRLVYHYLAEDAPNGG